MFNKINVKWLIGIFAILLIVTVIVIIINKSGSAASRNRTFKSNLVEFDTATATRITIIPKMGGDPVNLFKKEGQWKVTVGDKDYNANPSDIKNLLSSIRSLRALRIASTTKDQWKKYEVTDSAATHVIVNEGKKAAANVYLGKFSYQQPKNTNPYMMYQQQGKMTSYVRIAGDKRVYGVDGLIALSFNRKANDFRNQAIVRTNKENWNRLDFTAPDYSFSLTKQEGKWMADGLMTDSASMASYLGALDYLSSTYYVEDTVLTSNTPLYILSIEGENMANPIKIQAYPADTLNKFAITSSLNEGTYFSGSKNELFDKIFKKKESFLKSESEVTAEKK